jgi:hypothetical protein
VSAVALTEPATVEDLWLAIHEGAHCLVALRFGNEVAAVTIDDLDGGGCCYHRPANIECLRAPTLLEGPSLQLWPVETRRLFDRRYAVAAAGLVAEELYAPVDPGGYRPPSPLDGIRQQIIEELETAGFGYLVDRSTPPPPLDRKSDAQKMERAARVGSPGRASELYAALLHRDLVNWISSEVFYRPLKALVDELLVHRTISGEHAKRVVAEVDREMLDEVEELQSQREAEHDA